ncbi:MAG: ATP-dependent zinc metalloprotease FtsH [Planctomycetia bacterium]|nr:ATP-dependent zinc metalloprotease FtsH [Planctomycetia bacterium]
MRIFSHQPAEAGRRAGVQAMYDVNNNRDDDRPTISDDTYERIPEHLRGNRRPGEDPDTDSQDASEEKSRQSNSRVDQTRRNRSTGGGGGEPPRNVKTFQFTLRLPHVIFFCALIAIFLFGYQTFFVSRSSEITWTGFNRLVESNQIESVLVKGQQVSGKLREAPAPYEWPELLADGRRVFTDAIVAFDRQHPKEAEALRAELESEKVKWKRHIFLQAQTGQERHVLQLKNEDDTVLRSMEIPSDSSEEQLETYKTSLKDAYLLARKIQQRWRAQEAVINRPAMKDAVVLVDNVNNKATNLIFYKYYTCQAPSFAFADPEVDERLRQRVDEYTSTEPSDGTKFLTIASILATLFIFFMVFRMMRNASEQMGGGNFNSFTRSLAKRYEPDRAKRVTFKDVAGCDQVKAELEEVVDYLKRPEKYERMGARVPKGTLLFGPPGTGKTLLARAVAGEAKVPFFSINGSEFIQMFVGVGASRVRDIFTTAKENAPSILFIDEIDAVGRQRGAGVGGGQDEREQTLNQILSEMDGFAPNESVMVLASTNRPDVLDPALMRPGRFDRHITVSRPSLKGRRDIFKVYLKKIPYGADVDIDKLAKGSSGFTGADISNLVNEATLWATRNNKNSVDASDFDYAFEKIALGLKRDEILTEESKRMTACHEAGHALVGWFVKNGSQVRKISIIPRGRALGVTWSLPDDDKLSYNASEARATLMQLLAGRVAEKLIYGETTSGVENDLQRATELARDMVARWGMSETLGPVSFPNSENHPFLGREMTTDSRSYSEETAKVIDAEIRRMIEDADHAALELIKSKRELFDQLVDALVEEEELDQARIREILGPSPNDPPAHEPSSSDDSAAAPVDGTDESSAESSHSSNDSGSNDAPYQLVPEPIDVSQLRDDHAPEEDADSSN